MQNWQMQEVLCFPAHFGTVQPGSKIKVEPNWHSEKNEDSIVVKGVYVLKGNMQFDFKEREASAHEGTFIEHVDIEKDEAYFEYAMPFSIDLPNDDIENVAVNVLKSTVDVNEAGQCVCRWDVRCDIEKKTILPEVEPVQEVKKVEVVKEEVKEEEVKEDVKEEVPVTEPLDYVKTLIEETPQLSSEEVDFLEQLAEAYSVVQVQLNTTRK